MPLGASEIFSFVKINGGNSGHVGNSGQRQFLQRICRRRRPRRRESFPTAACSVPYRRRCRRRPIRCKNCRCPELPTCPEFPPFTLLSRLGHWPIIRIKTHTPAQVYHTACNSFHKQHSEAVARVVGARTSCSYSPASKPAVSPNNFSRPYCLLLLIALIFLYHSHLEKRPFGGRQPFAVIARFEVSAHAHYKIFVLSNPPFTNPAYAPVYSRCS